jgi:hypothetical protein
VAYGPFKWQAHRYYLFSYMKCKSRPEYSWGFANICAKSFSYWNKETHTVATYKWNKNEHLSRFFFLANPRNFVIWTRRCSCLTEFLSQAWSYPLSTERLNAQVRCQQVRTGQVLHVAVLLLLSR